MQILSRMGSPIYEAETDNISQLVAQAIAAGADLSSADLSSADLSSAELSSADLRFADLRFADLSSADLSSADLRFADLSSAELRYGNLRYGNLSSADLSFADLRYGNLSSADLRFADLRYADLRSADLSSADLRFADLSSADLRFADLRSATIDSLASARLSIVASGDLVVWKKLRQGVAKLLIPADAKRSNATGRKCRAEFAKVLELPEGVKVGTSKHDAGFEYRVGEVVRADNWCDDRWQECAGGIHFFLTREEAEVY